MHVNSFLRALPRLAVPALLLAGLEGYCLFGPVPEALVRRAVAAPYAAPSLLGLAIVLGLVFHQHRVSGTAIVCLAAAVALRLAFARDEAHVRMASLLLGLFGAISTVFLYLTPEGKLATGYSALRLSVPCVAGFLLLGLPRGVDANLLLSSLPGLGGGAGVPMAGIAALVLAAPFLVFSRTHESPVLGLFLWLALACAVVAADVVCRGAGERTLLVLQAGFAAGATALTWGVLDGAWWHANVDELTQLPGRRLLKHEMSSLRGGYTIAIVDVDHFKQINDRHGHDVGDQVLRFLAARLRTCPGSTAYRHGGEEFTLVFPRGSYEGHLAALESLRTAIEEKRFAKRAAGRPRRRPKKRTRAAGRSDTVGLTVSIGAAHSGERFPTPEDVHAMADKALYRAKRAGRNRVSRAMKSG